MSREHARQPSPSHDSAPPEPSAAACTRSNCPITCALDVLGDRWTLVVLRDILLGGRSRFSEFAQAEGIATNVLTERLQRLEAAGIIVRHRDPADGRRRIYEATARGRALVPVLLELLVWGVEHTDGTAHAALGEAYREDPAGVLARLNTLTAPQRK